MRLWSRYNTLFCSEELGLFLYNALSGIMLELDEVHFNIVQNICNDRKQCLSSEYFEFLNFLEEKGFLAERNDELKQLMQMHYIRNISCYNTSHISLTVCPTLACNFGCPYCFEQRQDEVTVMSDETINALISFIKKHHDAKSLSVSWYGGEPTLAFDVINRLTKKFLNLYPERYNAGLITNGYALGQSFIKLLDELKITSIQITIDGDEATHNRRRMLKGGYPTYEKILKNIDLLADSSWQGNCFVRVNIDRENLHEYGRFREKMIERYKEKNISVYPGFIQTFPNHTYDQNIGLCNSEWAAFYIDGYHKEGIIPRGGFYPGSGAQNTCIATSHYGYVIGPTGEIYKCWEDVGKEPMVIGSVYDEEPVSNKELVAQYSIGTDPYNDNTCMECSILPICGGGCVNKRLASNQFGVESMKYCSPLKTSLIDYLETYIYILRQKENCAILLGETLQVDMRKGYRMVNPEKKKVCHIVHTVDPLRL